MPVDFIDNHEIRSHSWDIAEHYGLVTLYDAAFLACTEVTSAGELWTADQRLLHALEADMPAYARALGVDHAP